MPYPFSSFPWTTSLLFSCAAFVVLAWVLILIAWWKIFRKAGERGWKSLIPILNAHVFYRIAWSPAVFWCLVLLNALAGLFTYYNPSGQNGLLNALVGLCSIVSFILYVVTRFKLSRAFGHGFWFALGLLFFPYIFYLILGLGASRYQRL